MKQIACGSVALSLLLVCHHAGGAETVTGFFNLDTLRDTLTYSESVVPHLHDWEEDHNIATIKFSLATGDGKKERIVRKYHILESHIAIASKKVGELTILDGGDIAGAIKHFRTYRYNQRMKDWFLTKDIYYARQGWIEPSDIGVEYPDGTEGLDDATKIDKSQAEIEPTDDRRARLSKELSALYDSLSELHKTHKLAKMPASAYDDLLLAEMIYNVPVTEQTVETYNNIGFFFSENKEAAGTALYVLSKVVKAMPERTAAYLNIADVYFEVTNLPEAKAAYAKYIEQMKAQGKEKKIPQRALDRVKVEATD